MGNSFEIKKNSFCYLEPQINVYNLKDDLNTATPLEKHFENQALSNFK